MTYFTERLAEEREHGYVERVAASRALAATANLISAAGVIMMVAFLSVLLSSTASLNEIAFMLIVGILIDCFITTKVVIPASVALTGKLTFWPRTFQSDEEFPAAIASGHM